MTIINEKLNQLQIIIPCTEPDEFKDAIFKALYAAIRWNGCCSDSVKKNVDGENLIVITELLESMVEIKKIAD